MADPISRDDAPSAQPLLSRLGPSVALYWLATATLMALLLLPRATDWIGSDNDDVMRLVEVRDWLGGQGWFDLMQYRLGLEGGTPMHWSRLVDAPIGLLIRLFSSVMPVIAAEAAAASLWPLLLGGLLLFPVGLAGRRLGGVRAMHIALGLGSIFVFTCVKFRPGALDHHNVQLVLAMWIAALLADRKGRPLGHMLAAVAAALAIAVGAETVPFVAAACLCVAMRWIWQGAVFSACARAFGLSLALTVTMAFVATVPPPSYAVVTCDSLSFGFYSLAAIGGAGLFAIACLPARSLPVRIAAAAVLGTVLGTTAYLVAPQCLGSPLANLDPMLVELWLKNVTEARSIVDQIRLTPELVPGFYAVGFAAMVICLLRVLRRQDPGIYLLFLVLIGVSWGVSLIQVRGTFFASLMSIIPFALLISELQMKVRRNPRDLGATLAFVAVALLSVPAVWGIAGLAWKGGTSLGVDTVFNGNGAEEAGECGNAADMAALGSIAAGTVAAPSNSGADILRYTHHRVLAAPYHRNQGGMLTELHIGMALPSEALAFLKGARVSVVAFCKSDPQTETLVGLKKDGLYASLAKGQIPAYLSPIAVDGGRFSLFKVDLGEASAD